MGAGASAADGRVFCHGCGSRTAMVEGVERPRCTVCGATECVEITDARLPVTSPTSAMRALSLGASMPSSSTAPATSLRVESVTVVALERPEDGGLLLRVLPNVVARQRSGERGETEPGSLSASLSFGVEDVDQDWELPAEPACDAFVSRLKASPHQTICGGHCVICAEDIVEYGTPVVTLNCQHVFHEDCIRRWLTRRHTCPTCRLELEVDDVRYLRSIGLKEEADALEKVKQERMAQEQQQQAAERRRWVESMRRGEPVHFGLVCGSCAVSPVVGDCFRCKDCEDFVLCGECHKNCEEWHSPTHTFAPFGVMPSQGTSLNPSATSNTGNLLTVLVPPTAARPPVEAPETQTDSSAAAAEVAFAAVRSLALAPLAGRTFNPTSPVSGFTNRGTSTSLQSGRTRRGAAQGL
ncbi:unnamed protein product [Symbiodinium natans]|uniref:RING-type domain-containing protein n=1 Tax=Symbiodinium natans TaxID=878477 RepID=A0A812RDV2_9DINO|nr:unnamed protein product [Symbiodinium natans]